jgi:quercetin dioxygenase-like cupin family protein
MAFYKAADLQGTPDVKNPRIIMKQVGGELIKIGIVTYQYGEGPLPHYHPNDEQFIYMLEGRAAFLLGDEIEVLGPGDLLHIPRNTVHGIHVAEGPVRFFSCKSPAGTGKLSEDYTEVPNNVELAARLASAVAA